MEGEFGYAYRSENRSEILARSLRTYHAWRTAIDDMGFFKEPAEIDPREWFEIHNQGNQGSCQGQSLADSVDYCHYLDTGENINCSRGFAYLASQAQGNLIGSDSGSTLDGGSKAAKIGLPLEDVFPYTENYKTLLANYRSKSAAILADATKLYKLMGEVPLANEEDCKQFLATHSGIIHIGIMWGVADSWEITGYNASGGGHAVTIAGYLKHPSWGYGYLLKNSWGQAWGKDGWGLLKPSVVTSMIKARYSVFLGRSAPQTPKPKILDDI